MSSNDIIVSLDIGTSKVRAIIGEVNNGAINIIGVGSADSEGIRKGAIVDIDQTVQSIRNAIEHAERMVGIQISDVYVGIQGNHIALQTNHGVVAVSNEDREIGEEDIERVVQAAKVVALPPEREIINLVPKQYLVDGLEGISDPRGMIGVRLEVEATIVTGAKTAIHNLMRCVEKAGLRISGVILMSLASGVISLTKDEKTMGTVLADIGAGSCTITIFEQGGLAATSTLPIGGEYVTNDIAYGLRTQSDQAEKIKLKYGCSYIGDAAEDVKFKVLRMGSNVEKEFSQVDLASIIEPRMQEIFSLIKQEVRRLGYHDKVSSYVLTGGAVTMPGTLALAQAELESTVRVALPDYIGVRDPAYSSGVGMIQYVSKYMGVRGTTSTVKKAASSRKTGSTASSKPGMFERIKNMFNEFI
ncbi:cell division protein FtsA [Paenibacillus sp. BIHB 4019]|uniref:Cell division protein FtsA n=1 Tax=Paenibacillus sp. BIHB 4019 TaxID=1870819 RepID=A0A1B2DQH1_9BACL|nr:MULTISPECIES: cell division protein FtsA [unclassified Paenibacillus]ANY69945.1 cell division protein FtsA [Paenibacillus sp. BIHB 4019]KQN97632.1 cell division protein FtsA [Paenibacillus sp. Leaf72]